MADNYRYQVMGTGKTVGDALENAEGKLPFPLKEPTKYEGYTTLPHQELSDGQGYSVIIAYTLAPSSERQAQGRVRPASSQGSEVQPSTAPRGRRIGAGAGVPSELERVVGNLKLHG